jgi:SH3 domain protein
VNKVLVFLSLFLVLGGNVLAETRYVSDHLEITMRSGKSTSHGITRMLRSGTPVEVLETDKKTGYSHVRTRSGKDGWVLSRFLMKGPAARNRLTTAEKKLAELELENRKMITGMQAIKQAKNSLQRDQNSLAGEHRKVSQELSEIKRTASSALAMDSENK